MTGNKVSLMLKNKANKKGVALCYTLSLYTISSYARAGAYCAEIVILTFRSVPSNAFGSL